MGGGLVAAVKTAQEYRRYADECRALAVNLSGDQLQTVLAMVATWQRLADEREEILTREPQPGS